MIQHLGGINRFWAKTSNSLYGVGDKENIWLFNNQDWNRINIGELKFYDIKGSSINGNEIYAIAANQSVNSNKKIFRIEDNILTEMNVTGIPSSIRGIWFKPGEKYYVVGSGMFYKNNINSNESWISFGESVTPYYTNSIDGNDVNDIVVCGAYGELLHYNGSTWKSYQKELEMQAGSYRTIKIKDNLLVAVGYDSPNAVITIGRR
jgi:WD40 repeat protein